MKTLASILILALAAVLSGCKRIEYVQVPVETVRTDTAYVSKVDRDSIYLRDSIYVMEKGDTVTVWKFRYLYRDKTVRDTIFRSRTDSIQVPVVVEKELTRWQKAKLDIGGIAIGIALAAIIGGALWLVGKFHNRE